MRIGVDLTALLPVETGVDKYLINLILGLGRVDQRNHYTVFLNYEDKCRLGTALPDNFTRRYLCSRPRLMRLLFQQAVLPVTSKALSLDVLHSPSFILPLLSNARHLLTVHDMTFFTLPQCHSRLRRSTAYRRAVVCSIRRAGLVHVPSESVKCDILRLLPEIAADRIRVIGFGVDPCFHPRPLGETKAAMKRLGLPGKYILFVGTIEPRKNLERLIVSYQKLVNENDIAEHLVLVGRLGWEYDRLLNQIRTLECRDRIHLRGYVDQHDLPWVYAGARLFVYPSLQEGFGFPPLEAMATGIPTIVSHSSSLTENLDGATEQVPPEDIDDLTLAMKRMLGDERLRRQRREQGLSRAAQFLWDETAKQTIACYEQLAEKDEGIKGKGNVAAGATGVAESLYNNL